MRSGERGGAAVEFAFVLPIFLLLVFGTIEYGWYFHSEQIVTAAAREGARTGTTVDPTVPGAGSSAAALAKQTAENWMAMGGLRAQGVTVTIVPVPGAPKFNGIRVDINYPFGGLTGFGSIALPSTVRATASMLW